MGHKKIQQVPDFLDLNFTFLPLYAASAPCTICNISWCKAVTLDNLPGKSACSLLQTDLWYLSAKESDKKILPSPIICTKYCCG